MRFFGEVAPASLPASRCVPNWRPCKGAAIRALFRSACTMDGAVQIGLVLIDEVHLLGENRGAALEAGCISRIRVVAQAHGMQHVRAAFATVGPVCRHRTPSVAELTIEVCAAGDRERTLCGSLCHHTKHRRHRCVAVCAACRAACFWAGAPAV